VWSIGLDFGIKLPRVAMRRFQYQSLSSFVVINIITPLNETNSHDLRAQKTKKKENKTEVKHKIVKVISANEQTRSISRVHWRKTRKLEPRDNLYHWAAKLHWPNQIICRRYSFF